MNTHSTTQNLRRTEAINVPFGGGYGVPSDDTPENLAMVFSFAVDAATFSKVHRHLAAIAPAVDLFVQDRGIGWGSSHRSTSVSEQLIVNVWDVEGAVEDLPKLLDEFEIFFPEHHHLYARVVGIDVNGNHVDYTLNLRNVRVNPPRDDSIETRFSLVRAVSSMSNSEVSLEPTLRPGDIVELSAQDANRNYRVMKAVVCRGTETGYVGQIVPPCIIRTTAGDFVSFESQNVLNVTRGDPQSTPSSGQDCIADD